MGKIYWTLPQMMSVRRARTGHPAPTLTRVLDRLPFIADALCAAAVRRRDTAGPRLVGVAEVLAAEHGPVERLESRPADAISALAEGFDLNEVDERLLAVAVAGVLGYFLIRWGCEAAPLLLGFVLGPLLEENLRRAMIISRGDPSVFVTRPISATLLALALIIVVAALLPSVRKKREVVFSGEDD